MKKPHIAFIDAWKKPLLLGCCLAIAFQFSCKEKSAEEENPPGTSGETVALTLTSEILLRQSVLMLAIGEHFSAHKSFPVHLKEIKPSKELSSVFGSKQELFRIKPPGHSWTDEVREISSLEYDNNPSKAIEDTGGWLYFNNPASRHYGKLLVDCDHQTADSGGKIIKFYQLAE